MNVARLVIAAAYVALMIYPAYVAGTAPGEPITAGRLALYTSAIVISVAAGFALAGAAWRFALPALVAAAWFEAEVIVVAATESRIFPAPEFYGSLAILAACEGGAMWLGGHISSYHSVHGHARSRTPARR